MKDDRLYLRHILDCCSAIRLHVAGGREEFLHDRKTQKAVLRELQELAESAQPSVPTCVRHFPPRN